MNHCDSSKWMSTNTSCSVIRSEHCWNNNFLFYKYSLKKRGFDVIFTGGILPASEVVEIYKTKSFEYLIVNSSSFDFAEKKIAYFSNIGKSLMLKRIIFTDSPSYSNKKAIDKMIFTNDPEDFIKVADSIGRII